MKTVHQWLTEIDENDLVSNFKWNCPIEFWRLENKELTVAEVYARQERAFKAFISDLKAMKPEPNGNMIFLATSAFEERHPEIQPVLVALDEIDNENVEHYGWMLTNREEWLGYYVADTELTNDNICTILAQILEEASFFGYSQEKFEAERDDLRRSLEESEKDFQDGRTYTMEEVREHLGLPPEKEDLRADVLLFKVFEAKSEYCKYCLNRELNALRQLIKKVEV